MIYTDLTKKSMKIAYEAHQGQLDKAGIPYIYHPIHLAEQMSDEYSVIVALLHDVVEDSDITIDQLINYGFPVEVIEALKLLTHNDGTDYMVYIKSIATNELATKVKIVDLKHNSDLSRLSYESDESLKKLLKYEQALEHLQNR